MSNLDKILNFIELIQKFRSIERLVHVNGKDRNENDVEHSFSLAMLGWYINDTEKLGLNLEKIIKYALIHDLVEVHAGDTFFYHKDSNMTADKKEREERAAHKLRGEYPEFPELHSIMEKYEKREDKESKFVYALDKIEPVLNIYLDKGRSWRRDKVSMEMIKSKIQQVASDGHISKIFSELLSKLQREEKELFNKE